MCIVFFWDNKHCNNVCVVLWWLFFVLVSVWTKKIQIVKLYNCAHIHARFSIQADCELTGGSSRWEWSVGSTKSLLKGGRFCSCMDFVCVCVWFQLSNKSIFRYFQPAIANLGVRNIKIRRDKKCFLCSHAVMFKLSDCIDWYY